jgi:hypothetical protein
MSYVTVMRDVVVEGSRVMGPWGSVLFLQLPVSVIIPK